MRNLRNLKDENLSERNPLSFKKHNRSPPGSSPPHLGSLQLGMALCEGSARGSSPPHLWTGDSFICPNIKLAEAQSKRNSFEHFSIASPVGSKESSLIRSPLLSFSTPPLLSFSTPPLLSFSSLKWALHRMFSSVSTNINSQRFPRFNQPKG